MNRLDQRGMAVVVAILLVALAASTAVFMLSRHDLWSRQVESLASRAQADALARAGIDWAERTLANDRVAPDARAAQALIRETLERLAMKDAELDIGVTDAQAYFNLNNLVRADRPSEPNLQVFRRFLVAARSPPELANAVVDAIDGDSETTLPGGAEDLDYLSGDPPQVAANRPMIDAAHLARVKGFTPQAVALLRPLLVALPDATSINVNTAPFEVLMGIVSGLDADAARGLVAARADSPYNDVEAFRARLPPGASVIPGVALGVASRYFLVVSRARSGRSQVAYQALIAKQGATQRGVIWRKQGQP